MKEYPILFSSEMVRAILEGKTQTRRVIKPQPVVMRQSLDIPPLPVLEWKSYPAAIGEVLGQACPYGQPGDWLWVRETWAVSKRLDGIPPHKLEFLTSNPDFPIDTIYYRADSCNGVNPLRGRWRSSIHMPRWASRIDLEITGNRIERVQDISEEDARAEVGEWGCDTIEVFQELWDSINAKRGFGWDVNPWVWVIEFVRVET